MQLYKTPTVFGTFSHLLEKCLFVRNNELCLAIDAVANHLCQQCRELLLSTICPPCRVFSGICLCTSNASEVEAQKASSLNTPKSYDLLCAKSLDLCNQTRFDYLSPMFAGTDMSVRLDFVFRKTFGPHNLCQIRSRCAAVKLAFFNPKSDSRLSFCSTEITESMNYEIDIFKQHFSNTSRPYRLLKRKHWLQSSG